MEPSSSSPRPRPSILSSALRAFGATAPETPSGGAQPFPDMEDLRERLRFCPENGRIWLDDNRMALIHVPALAALRREMIESLGLDVARGLLTRMGYTSGSTDASLARKVRGKESLLDAFSVGPQLHSLEGIVHVEPITVEIDPSRGHYFGEFLWKDSIEVDCHLSIYGKTSEPTCWMQIGYACGYTTVFVGRPILFREIECRATGAPHCRIIGKPVEEWKEGRDDVRFLSSEGFANSAPAVPVFANGGAQSILFDDAPDDPTPFEELVGASSSFNAACHNLKMVASTRATVLFLGETGVGKEMFARTLHRISKRAAQPFIAVNCAAIPDTLMEAELFGVEKGAFTGAVTSRPGRFERADGGTLFLDEVGALSLSAQAKLLRALQCGEIERIGGIKTRKVDVRVVAATNEDLAKKIADASFRTDLFYRINVFPVHLPPLRERRDDIPLLIRHFLNRFSKAYEKTIPGLTERAIAALLDYEYPGNIRELEHMMERAVILATDKAPIDVYLLFSSSRPKETGSFAIDRQGHLRSTANEAEESGPWSRIEAIVTAAIGDNIPLEKIERTIMEKAVDLAGGNLTRAARAIGLTRPQLAYRLKKQG